VIVIAVLLRAAALLLMSLAIEEFGNYGRNGLISSGRITCGRSVNGGRQLPFCVVAITVAPTVFHLVEIAVIEILHLNI